MEWCVSKVSRKFKAEKSKLLDSFFKVKDKDGCSIYFGPDYFYESCREWNSSQKGKNMKGFKRS